MDKRFIWILWLRFTKKKKGVADQNEAENYDIRFLEEEDECNDEIEGMTLNAIELVSTVVTKDSLHPLIKQSVYPIINVLAHFVLLTTEQVHKS